MTPTKQRPIPLPDELTQPFWQAAQEGRLVIQHCTACGYYNHPPKPLCDRCLSAELAFEPVSGQGSVYSYTVMYQKNIAGFEDRVPYVNLMIELDEQPLLLLVSTLDGDGTGVSVGQRVEVTFERISEGVVLPQFRLLA